MVRGLQSWRALRWPVPNPQSLFDTERVVNPRCEYNRFVAFPILPPRPLGRRFLAKTDLRHVGSRNGCHTYTSIRLGASEDTFCLGASAQGVKKIEFGVYFRK